MKKSVTKFALLSLTFICFIPSPAISQNILNAHLGYGFPDCLNFGLRYQFPQVQLGVSYGFLSDFRSISGDVYVHFGGQSMYLERKPWYFRSGVVFFKESLEYTITKYTMLPFRIGRDLNINEKIGMQIDFGITFKLSEEVIEKQRPSLGLGYYGNIVGIFTSGEGSSWPAITPAIGIALFYRL